MDLDDASAPTPLQQIVRRVSQELHGRGILAPRWLVQAAVERHFAAARPLAPEVHGLDAVAVHALAITITDTVAAAVTGPASAGSPAVLDLDEAGSLCVALGVTAHCALLNAAPPQPVLAAILGRVASCMMVIGSAAQDAHRAGDAALLLPADTTELAREALAGTLAEVRAGRWTIAGDEDARTAVVAVLQAGLSRLH